jgi:hypothetical protein
MLSEATWIVSFPMFFAFRRKGSTRKFLPSGKIIAICAVIGFGYAMSKSAISYSESKSILENRQFLLNSLIDLLPGSVFAIIASVDILFNGIFGRLILKKKVSKCNKIAIIVVICGALPSAISDIIIAPGHRGAVDKAQQVTGLTLALAIPLVLFGIAEESLSTVFSSYILKKRLHDEANLPKVAAAVSVDGKTNFILPSRLMNMLCDRSVSNDRG